MKFIYFDVWKNKKIFVPFHGFLQFFSDEELSSIVQKITGVEVTTLLDPELSILDGSRQSKFQVESLDSDIISGWYDSEGFYLGEFLTVEGLSFTEIKNLMPLEAPFFQAFWSDYDLFRNAIKAYKYGVEYVDYWNEELNDCFANKPYIFEEYSEREGFDLVWETRRGNYLFYSFIRGKYTEKYDEEESEIEGDYLPEETKVCIELRSSIAWGLFRILNERETLERLTFSSEKYVPWE